MIVPFRPRESEYGRRVRTKLHDLLPQTNGQDAKFIEIALSRGFDMLSGEQVTRLNVILRRSAPLGPA